MERNESNKVKISEMPFGKKLKTIQRILFLFWMTTKVKTHGTKISAGV